MRGTEKALHPRTWLAFASDGIRKLDTPLKESAAHRGRGVLRESELGPMRWLNKERRLLSDLMIEFVPGPHRVERSEAINMLGLRMVRDH